MKFLINVIKIFFRNKRKEIKGVFSTRSWYNIVEVLTIIGISVVIGLLLFGISFVTGYVLIDVLDWVDVNDTPYITIGFLFWGAIFIVWIGGYGIYHFIKWTWTNIKIAIAEAKELT